jgi:hypothetical protein
MIIVASSLLYTTILLQNSNEYKKKNIITALGVITTAMTLIATTIGIAQQQLQ